MALGFRAELCAQLVGIDCGGSRSLSVTLPSTLAEPHRRARSVVAGELPSDPRLKGRQARDRECPVILGEAIEHLERFGLRVGAFGFRIGRPEGFELGGVREASTLCSFRL